MPKLTPNYIKPEQIARFFVWLEKRWGEWRLPILFYTVMGMVGCRIHELCSLRSGQLREGRLGGIKSAEDGNERLCPRIGGSSAIAVQVAICREINVVSSQLKPRRSGCALYIIFVTFGEKWV